MNDHKHAAGRPLLLVLDDEPDICMFITDVAGDAGFNCVSANSFEDFKNLYSPGASVVVVDLVLGESDGIEVLRYLAGCGCEADIIPISGYDGRTLNTAHELASALGLNVPGHLQKPIRLAQLEDLLARCGPRMAPEPRTPAAYTPTSVELKNALEEEQFELHYQPKIDIKTGAAVGFEALVRWQHPDNGLLSPASFLDGIESGGLMEELTWLVVRRSLRDYREIFSDVEPLPALAINMSADTLTDLGLPDKISMLAQKEHVPADRIVIEVTESGFMGELAKALDILARLRLKGIGLSIDDFGNGYSMLQQLRRVPANELKVDKSFVQSMDTKDSAVIVRKAIELGHEFGMDVVAEGVETPGQLADLKDLGCDTAQGFLFSKPLPPAELGGTYRSLSHST